MLCSVGCAYVIISIRITVINLLICSFTDDIALYPRNSEWVSNEKKNSRTIHQGENDTILHETPTNYYK